MRRLHLTATAAAAGILAATGHAAPGASATGRDANLACPAAPARFVKTVTVDVTVCVAPAASPTPEPCPGPDGKGKHAEGEGEEEVVVTVTATTTSVVTVFVVPEAKGTPEGEAPECPEGETWSWFDAPAAVPTA